MKASKAENRFNPHFNNRNLVCKQNQC